MDAALRNGEVIPVIDDEGLALRIVEALRTAEYAAHLGDIDGLRVEGVLNEAEIVLLHNLGGRFGDAALTKAEAGRILLLIEDFYSRIYHASADLQRFLGHRGYSIELYVFSGQMDFRVAKYRRGHIEWLTELPE